MNESKLPHAFFLATVSWFCAAASHWFQWAQANASTLAAVCAALASIAAIWHAIPSGLLRWREWRNRDKGKEL